MINVYLCLQRSSLIDISTANQQPPPSDAMNHHRQVTVSIIPPLNYQNFNEQITPANSDIPTQTVLYSFSSKNSKLSLSENYKTERDTCTKHFDNWSEHEQVILLVTKLILCRAMIIVTSA